MSEPVEAPNVLHIRGPELAVWSTANAGEAMPGVLTPLNWSIFGDVAELSMRSGFRQMGVISAKELRLPDDVHQRCIGIFFGHAALKVDFLCEMASRMPGGDGATAAMQILGSAPPGLPQGAQAWRYPFIVLRLPWLWRTFNRRLDRQLRATSVDWWRDRIRKAESLTLAEAKDQMREGYQHFLDTTTLQTISLAAVIQPAFAALSTLIEKAQRLDLRGDLMAGYGSHAESSMVCDMWAISRGRKSLEEFVSEHGYHGPREGEISSKVWREDPAPLRRMIEGYQRLGDESDPALLEAEKMQRRLIAERELLGALPGWYRPLGKLILRIAGHFVPTRGMGKAAEIRAMDVLRATARRMGQLLTQAGALDAFDDVFYLTYDELMGEVPGDAKRLVIERKRLVKRYALLDLPRWWRGPQPVPVLAAAPQISSAVTMLQGIAASMGIVEGVVEVVTDPNRSDVPHGCILVTPTTDPSWVPLMFLSKALVVDTGGTLSHAAVVARELGLPCVVGTNRGSRSLRSGDYCRVDGGAGTVEVLRRAATADHQTP